MKTSSPLILFISVVPGFSQDLNYGVKGSVHSSGAYIKCSTANKMIDINPGWYPSSGYSYYISADQVASYP
ncbi:MAG: hypothetical protein IPO25_21650 [Saprospiraceae bacterium]|nr:hypothetical protein [Saprospiraceae bacterium]